MTLLRLLSVPGALPAPAALGSLGSGVPSEEVVTAALFPRKRQTPDCWSLVHGEMWNQPCDKPYPWICEKSPDLSRGPEPHPLFLAKD